MNGKRQGLIGRLGNWWAYRWAKNLLALIGLAVVLVGVLLGAVVYSLPRLTAPPEGLGLPDTSPAAVSGVTDKLAAVEQAVKTGAVGTFSLELTEEELAALLVMALSGGMAGKGEAAEGPLVGLRSRVTAHGIDLEAAVKVAPWPVGLSLTLRPRLDTEQHLLYIELAKIRVGRIGIRDSLLGPVEFILSSLMGKSAGKQWRFDREKRAFVFDYSALPVDPIELEMTGGRLRISFRLIPLPLALLRGWVGEGRVEVLERAEEWGLRFAGSNFLLWQRGMKAGSLGVTLVFDADRVTFSPASLSGKPQEGKVTYVEQKDLPEDMAGHFTIGAYFLHLSMRKLVVPAPARGALDSLAALLGANPSLLDAGEGFFRMRLGGRHALVWIEPDEETGLALVLDPQAVAIDERTLATDAEVGRFTSMPPADLPPEIKGDYPKGIYLMMVVSS